MEAALNALGFPIGRSKIRRLMKEASVHVRYRRKYKVTTNSNHKKPLFDNVLNRQFKVNGPNQAYVSDITYCVLGAQGEHGHLNEPQVYLKYPVSAQGIMVH
jgi:transposase InsO family protein